MEELGNPMLSKEGLVALNEYMEQWDLLRKRQSDDNDFYIDLEDKMDWDVFTINKIIKYVFIFFKKL